MTRPKINHRSHVGFEIQQIQIFQFCIFHAKTIRKNYGHALQQL
jgi:hypothetical protein